MNITRVLTNQSALLTQTLYQDGTQTDLGTVTIGIVDANGAVVVAAGTAVTDPGDGTYSFTLPAQTAVGFLTATWTVTGGPSFPAFVEVVASELFTEFDLRNFDDGAITAASFSDTAVAQSRDRVTDFLEHETGRSWIRRYCRVLVDGSGSRRLSLWDSVARTSSGLELNRPGRRRDISRIIAASIDGVAVPVADLTVTAAGTVDRRNGYWTPNVDPLNVTLEYEYGLGWPVDGVDRIAMMITRQRLVPNRIPENAATYADDLASYSFDPTRLPREAWQWIRDHDLRLAIG